MGADQAQRRSHALRHRGKDRQARPARRRRPTRRCCGSPRPTSPSTCTTSTGCSRRATGWPATSMTLADFALAAHSRAARLSRRRRLGDRGRDARLVRADQVAAGVPHAAQRPRRRHARRTRAMRTLISEAPTRPSPRSCHEDDAGRSSSPNCAPAPRRSASMRSASRRRLRGPICRQSSTPRSTPGWHGDMAWMAETAERRGSPTALWPEARSVIMLGVNYAPETDPLASLAQRDRRRRSRSMRATATITS